MTAIGLPARNSILSAFGICIVALAVFGWGLQYKLSLYRAPTSGTFPVPSAKLLPPKDTVSLVTGPSAIAPDWQPPPALSLAMIAALMYVWQRCSDRFHSGSTESRSHKSGWYFGAVFFSFRPPPACNPAS